MFLFLLIFLSQNISNRKCCWGRLSDRSERRNLHKPLAAELLFQREQRVWTMESALWATTEKGNCNLRVAMENYRQSGRAAAPAAAAVTNSRRAKTFCLNGGCCHSRLCAGVKLTHIRCGPMVWA